MQITVRRAASTTAHHPKQKASLCLSELATESPYIPFTISSTINQKSTRCISPAHNEYFPITEKLRLKKSMQTPSLELVINQKPRALSALTSNYKKPRYIKLIMNSGNRKVLTPHPINEKDRNIQTDKKATMLVRKLEANKTKGRNDGQRQMRIHKTRLSILRMVRNYKVSQKARPQCERDHEKENGLSKVLGKYEDGSLSGRDRILSPKYQ